MIHRKDGCNTSHVDSNVSEYDSGNNTCPLHMIMMDDYNNRWSTLVDNAETCILHVMSCYGK